MPEMEEKLGFPRFPFLDLPCLQGIPRTIFVKPGGHSPVEFPVLPSHDSPFLFLELPTPSCTLQSTYYRLPINCLVIYWIEIDNYELLPQGGVEKTFLDRPLESGGDSSIYDRALIFTVYLIFKKHLFVISLSLWRSIREASFIKSEVGNIKITTRLKNEIHKN